MNAHGTPHSIANSVENQLVRVTQLTEQSSSERIVLEVTNLPDQMDDLPATGPVSELNIIFAGKKKNKNVK